MVVSYEVAKILKEIIIIDIKFVFKEMKKLFFDVMAMFAMSFAACGNKTEAAVETADTIADTLEIVDTMTIDSTAIAE